jgi:hypothetical protein
MPGPMHDGCLEHLRKEAKCLLKAARQGDATALARFTAHHPHFHPNSLRLVDAQLVIARELGYASWPKLKAAQQQHGTLAGELARVHHKLEMEGKAQFIPLLTSETVKHAIRKGRESYLITRPDPERGATYLEQVVWPSLTAIIEREIWPATCALDVAYTQTDEHGVCYDGIGVSLELVTSQAAFRGFSLAILDLWYGRFS